MSSMDTKPRPKEELKEESGQIIKGYPDNQNQIDKLANPSKAIPQENIDDDLLTLHKIHAILLNCINLSKKDKLEFCNSQRYFMKLYLRKMREQLEKE
ncbi:hypothetical protein LCGC14_2193330 [marine sediment metagenome]|uniref:Uncharacterized protein n=1 Tax=marine sediment metagenome TaxID=412755 RepID=A0A0F9DIW7_9ZZZZ